MSDTVEVVAWTCSRCEVTGSWMGDAEQSGMPLHWSAEGEEFFCLACRRHRAGESAIEDGAVEGSREDREQLRRTAVVEFELRRVPERNNAVIARACRTSPRVVANIRRSLD